MALTKDYIKVEVTGDADAVPSELYFENTIENPAWYTVEDNHVSLISENVEKVIKLETDMLDDCMWESRIEITKDVANPNNVELPLECQVVTDNFALNRGDTSDKIFHCNICGKSFDLNYLLKNHLAEHKRQAKFKTSKCKFCGKQFKLKSGLNKHIHNHHNDLYKCRYCKRFIDKTKYNEHKKSHTQDENGINIIPNIKLCKLNGVWKSKTNEFKCNICFQKCYSEKDLVEHMETHDYCQTQCEDCLDYVSVSELNDHREQIHNKLLFKCQKCNLQFEKQQHLNCHLIHCLKSSHFKSKKVCGRLKTNAKTCSACGIIFNNSLTLKNHTIIGCNHYTCKYCGKFFGKRNLWLKHTDFHKKDELCAIMKVGTDETSAVRECNQTEDLNDSSYNTIGGQCLSNNVTGRNCSENTRLVNCNATIVSNAPHTYIPSNYIIPNPGQTKILSNTLEKNSSNQTGLVNSNTTIVSTAPHNSMPDNYIIQNPGQTNILERNSSDQIGLVDSNATIVSTAPHNSMLDNYIISNPGQTNILERNSSDQIDLVNSNATVVSTAPHNSMPDNYIILNSGQTNILERNSSDQIGLVNSNATIVSTTPHNSMTDDYIIPNPGQTNILERNSSDQLGLVDSNATIVSTTPHNSMTDDYIIPNLGQTNILERNSSNLIDLVNRNVATVSNALANYNSSQFQSNGPIDNHIPDYSVDSAERALLDSILIMKQESHYELTIRQHFHRRETQRQTALLAASRNSITNINSHVPNIKQEPNLPTTIRETNSSVEINLANSNESIVSTASHDSMANNCHVIHIKQEKILTNNRETNSLDQVDSVNSYESSAVANNPRDLMVKQNPINITEREAPYFCIKKLPNIKNKFCNDVNGQLSQNNFIFICRICKKSPSTDIHAFALHMSYHTECNMHECIVCDKTFITVILWANHMTYHQQQIDLNVSSESNTLDTVNSENVEPQVRTTLRNRKFEISSLNDSLNNSDKKIKYQYDCSTCKKVFPSKITREAHQTLHNKSQPFSCRYCDKVFSGKGPCTNHEKSHIGADIQFLQNNESNNFEANFVIQNNRSIEDNNTDSETMSVEHIKKSKSSTIKKTNFCNFCNRKFTKRCYFTNHMVIKHHINPNTPKQLTSIDRNESIILSENIELTNKYKNKLSVPVDNNLNNYVSKSNAKKSTFCTICNKHFGHFGALTNHMNSHSDRQPYKCQYCYRQFSRKVPYTMHEKKHELQNVVKSASSQNKNNLTFEVDEKPQIEHCNDIELVHSSVNGNSNSKKLMNTKRLWFPCDVCEKKFSTPFQLNDHRKSHPDIVPYVCKICNKSYQLKFRWNCHLKVHYLKRNTNLKIQQHSSNLIPNIGKLNVESLRHQDKIKCRYCKKDYNSISQWKKHMTMNKECRRHCKSNLSEFASNKATENSTISARFQCNICKKMYSSSSNRTMHIKNVHNKVLDTTDLNTYDEIGLQKEQFVDKIHQKPTIKKQNRSNDTKCKSCGKIYSSLANLKRHMSIIHAQSYEHITCGVCGSTFKHKYYYRQHFRAKHKHFFNNYKATNSTKKGSSKISINKKNNMKYFCKVCKMKFANNITLQEHLKIHTLNMYKCKDCGQQFETNVTLGNHILENHSANI